MAVTNAAIFNDPVFDLPKTRGNENLYDFLSRVYDDYLAKLPQFNKVIKTALATKIPFIKNQVATIKKSVDQYLKGFPSEAYSTLASGLSLLENSGYLPIQRANTSAESSSFYRVRVANSKTMKREELFHIPFEIREKAGTQRYSIPGLPCLYIADSIFVCWEELGRPTLDTLHVSRLDISQSGLRFLYLNKSTNEMRRQCFPNRDQDGKFANLLIPFLCYWPLLAACSVIVKSPNDVFKPEYIIPQLLLQWVVLDQSVDGVVYKSNRISLSSNNIGTFKNIVIPVRTVLAKGYCPELKQKIKLTNPISYQLLEIAGAKPVEEEVGTDSLRRAMYIELIEDEKAIYSETVFGKLEAKLQTLVATFLT